MIVGVIHAKGRSERLVGKNLKPLGGRPLVTYAIRAAQCSRLLDKVIIDSDDDAILKVGESCGAIPLKRPKELATNEITGDDLAYWQASNFPNSKAIVQIVPTSPFLFSFSIDRVAHAVVMKGKHLIDYDSACGVRVETLYTWEKERPAYYKKGKLPNSSELNKTIYETTGLYAVKTKYALRHKKRLNPKSCFLFPLTKIEAVNIDDEEDFTFAEIIWRGVKHDCYS